jgi:hypothetical protein
MKMILGFLAQKFGFSCGSRNSRSFIDGWFLGAGLTFKSWSWESRPFGRHEFKIGLVIHSRKDFKFGFSYTKYHSRIGRAFAFIYGVFFISHFEFKHEKTANKHQI